MSKLLGKYKNGNYFVTLLENGTKIRETEEDEFIPSFAENCDVTITEKCDAQCGFCYMGCTPQGKHGSIMDNKFIETLHPYTELALNGNMLDHPELLEFLEYLKTKHIIANLTVNQRHFMIKENLEFLYKLTNEKLIYGLGVSLTTPTDSFITEIKQFPNAVIHVINGIFKPSDITHLSNNGLKILILGYKQLERGIDFFNDYNTSITQNQSYLKENLADIIPSFKVVSFDNLAITQLEVQKIMSKENWDEFYMGDDGGFTFYIDLVNKKFAKNSLSQVKYDLLDNIDDMFSVIRNN